MHGKCPYITLSNGVQMPQVGLGVWRASEGEETVRNVQWALDAGYRLIDTATKYENEASVGRAIRESTVPRHEVFVTTKVWNDAHGYDATLAAFERSRAALGLDYIDLYLIHWPGFDVQKRHDTWRALEHLYAQKKVRAIGVSNFEPHHLRELLAVCTVPPMVNQVEMHPRFQQAKLRAFCQEHNIAVTAWRPLGLGTLLGDSIIVDLAKKHHRTTAQVVLRWFVQLGVIVIPKSSHEERIKENFHLFDFALDDGDMQRMQYLNQDERMGQHPDKFFDTN